MIDWVSMAVGRITMWLILSTTLISAGNAVVRKAFSKSSNGLLEIQWYLFAAVFMLDAGYGFLRNAHVRIDFLATRLSANTRHWIDIGGIVLVLVPFCLIGIALGWPFFSSVSRGPLRVDSGCCACGQNTCHTCMFDDKTSIH